MGGTYEQMNRLVHAGLRRDLDRIARVTQKPMPSPRREALARRVSWLVEFLHHHHVGEEEAIWPLAVRKRPQLGQLVEAMQAEHQALAAAADGLRHAAEAHAADGSEGNRQALVDALQGMRDATLPHLDHEETVAVPELVGIFTDREWKQIDKRFRRGLGLNDLGWILMWLLDDLDPAHEDFLRNQLPRPVIRFLTWRWARPYAREASLAWGTGRAPGPSPAARTVHASVVFPLPPSESWDFVFGDQARRAVEASRMVAAVEDYQMRPDGTPRYTMVMRMGPLTMRSISDYSLYDPPVRTANTVIGSPFGGRFFVELEPLAHGTRITERWETCPTSRALALLMPLLTPLLNRALQRDLNAWAAAAGKLLRA